MYLSKKPADYYFNVARGEDTLMPGTSVSICPIKYFDEYGCLYEQHLSKENGGPLGLPETIEELHESAFLFDGTPFEAQAALKNFGLVHNPELPV